MYVPDNPVHTVNSMVSFSKFSSVSLFGSYVQPLIVENPVEKVAEPTDTFDCVAAAASVPVHVVELCAEPFNSQSRYTVSIVTIP